MIINFVQFSELDYFKNRFISVDKKKLFRIKSINLKMNLNWNLENLIMQLCVFALHLYTTKYSLYDYYCIVCMLAKKKKEILFLLLLCSFALSFYLKTFPQLFLGSGKIAHIHIQYILYFVEFRYYVYYVLGKINYHWFKVNESTTC